MSKRDELKEQMKQDLRTYDDDQLIDSENKIKDVETKKPIYDTDIISDKSPVKMKKKYKVKFTESVKFKFGDKYYDQHSNSKLEVCNDLFEILLKRNCIQLIR